MKGLLYIRGSRRKVSQLTLAFQPYENEIIKEISKQSFSFTCKRNFNSGQPAQYGWARHKQTGDYKKKRRDQQPIPSTAGDGCWWCWRPCLLAHRSRRGYHQVGVVKNTQTCPKVVPKLSQSRPKVVPKLSQSCPNVNILLAAVTTIIKYSWKQSKQNY